MKRRWFAIRPAITLKGRKFKGIRGWAGKPFHPPLTDVPIGAYTLAAAFDLISWLAGPPEAAFGGVGAVNDPLRPDGFELGPDLYKAATFCLIAAVLASVPTAITGFWDWWKSTPPGTQAWRTANFHMAVMLTAQVAAILYLLFRLNIDMQLSTSFAMMLITAALFGLVALGATYGGGMVYDYAFNVEQDIDYAWEERESDVLPGQEKPVIEETP